MTNQEKTNIIRELNDQFRKAPTPSKGRLMITQGIQQRCDASVIQQVMTFDAFTEDNDPYGEHDFGAFVHKGNRVFWKIDYYDPKGEFGSDDPSDPTKTLRVLTIMLADEY